MNLLERQEKIKKYFENNNDNAYYENDHNDLCIYKQWRDGDFGEWIYDENRDEVFINVCWKTGNIRFMNIIVK